MKKETGHLDMRGNLVKLLLICLAIEAVLGYGNVGIASAQSGETTWSQPVNLSNSGSSSRPLLVVDNSGTIHAIWLLQNDSYFYRNSKDGKNWSKSAPVDFPFKRNESIPQLISDPAGYIHAFWTNEEHVLFYSRVRSADVRTSTAWKGPVALAESALDFRAAIDSAGGLHIGYVRGLNTNGIMAGVYYRRSRDSGTTWSDGAALYLSQYYRSNTAKDAHLRITTAHVDAGDIVYMAYDNRTLKRVFLSKSTNSGGSWIDPIEVQGPQAGTPNESPFFIEIIAQGANALLLWRTGVPDNPNSRCIQYSRWSTDQGQHWGEPQYLYKERWTCPTENELLTVKDGSFLIRSTLQNQMYLLAWNGSVWSNPLLQKSLALFTNPETFEKVSLGCLQSQFKSDGQVLVVGCDLSGGGDVWFASRAIGDVSAWFSQAVWTVPNDIFKSKNPISAPQVLADQQGRYHVFWLQPVNSEDTPSIRMFYKTWNTGRWSQDYQVFSSPHGNVTNPQVLYLTRDNSFIAAWVDGQDNLLYFSKVKVDNAANSVDWSKPEPLPVKLEGPGSFEMMVTSSKGIISMIFSVPINEKRGVYFIQSPDFGKTWSDSRMIFNGAAVGKEKVDSPHIIGDNNGSLFAIWSRYNTISNTAVGLTFAVSNDDGLTWTDPKPIVNDNLAWSGLIVTADRQLLVYWQRNSLDRFTTWSQSTLDKGKTWSAAEQIANSREPLGPLAATIDKSSNPLLLRIAKENVADKVMELWSRKNGTWLNLDTVLLDNNPAANIQDLDAAIGPSNLLTVVYIHALLAGTLPGDYTLYAAYRAMSGAPGSGEPLAGSIVQTAQPTVTPVPKKTLVPTAQPPKATSVIPKLSQGTSSSQASSSWLIGVAALLIFLGVGIGVFWYRRRKLIRQE